MEIFTIGYSGFSIEDFIDVLKMNDIKCLIDVRSLPYSQYHTEYNKDALKEKLCLNQIFYRNYSKEFGARQDNPIYYDNNGILDFGKYISSEQFQIGIKKIMNGIELGYSFAMMCAEKDPINCHRSIMVGQGFKAAGFDVKNIIDKQTIETQEELERRLLSIYYKDRDQISFFTPDYEDDSVLIENCYKKRNLEIGYNINDLKIREE